MWIALPILAAVMLGCIFLAARVDRDERELERRVRAASKAIAERRKAA